MFRQLADILTQQAAIFGPAHQAPEIALVAHVYGQAVMVGCLAQAQPGADIPCCFRVMADVTKIESRVILLLHIVHTLPAVDKRLIWSILLYRIIAAKTYLAHRIEFGHQPFKRQALHYLLPLSILYLIDLLLSRQ